MMNIYESKEMRKYLTNKKNPTFDATNIALNSRNLVCGPSGCGKTSFVANFLKLSPNTFEHIYVLCKCVENDPIYEMMRDKLKGSITFYTLPSQIPNLNTLSDKYEKKCNICFIIDDYVDVASKFPIIDDIFLRGRKFELTTFFLTQSYFRTNLFWRHQLNNVIIFRLTSKKDLNMVLSNYACDITIEELTKMYKTATETQLDFFKVNVNERDVKKKYTHNFTKYFEPTLIED